MSIKLLMRTNLWKISKSNALFLLKYMNMYAILASLNEPNKKKGKKGQQLLSSKLFSSTRNNSSLLKISLYKRYLSEGNSSV